MPHLKALRYGIYETRGLSCGSTSSICQGILKSGNLLQKLVFVKTLSLRTVLNYFALQLYRKMLKLIIRSELSDHKVMECCGSKQVSGLIQASFLFLHYFSGRCLRARSPPRMSHSRSLFVAWKSRSLFLTFFNLADATEAVLNRLVHFFLIVHQRNIWKSHLMISKVSFANSNYCVSECKD